MTARRRAAHLLAELARHRRAFENYRGRKPFPTLGIPSPDPELAASQRRRFDATRAALRALPVERIP